MSHDTSQTPFILSASIRENICFGLPYDEKRYQAVIEACALLPDLGTFAYGDLTMVGSKGYSLSGGQ